MLIFEKIIAFFLSVLAFFGIVIGPGEPTETTVAVNGSLACTDSLGRNTVTAGASEKLIGAFYFLWHGQHGSNRIIDNTELVKSHPEAINSEELWIASGGGLQQEFHFWGEPLLGYYSADDDWVFRKHVQMLTDAAVDFIVMDTTNAFTYSEPAKKLIGIWYEYYTQGWNVPKIAFYTNSFSGDTMNRIYDEIYNNSELNEAYPRLAELWFKLDGKPMIVGDKDDPVLRADVKDYFRIKANQWPNEDKKNDGFPWMEFDRSLTRKAVYKYDGTKIMNISVAQHSDTCTFSKTAWYGANDRTRSWHNGKNDTAENAMLYGYNFSEQWEYAIKQNPDIIFVTGFNEWVAQRQAPIEGAPVVFVDCADENASRDVEPSAGVLGDNYYLQMVNYIAKFKNSTSVIEKGKNVTIDISGSFDQWKNEKITAVYKDYSNDTAARNSLDFAKNPITDSSGRNDIVNMKVTEDPENYYFYVDTAQTLTAADGGQWMTLFINEKYAVNRTAAQNGKTAVEIKSDSGYENVAEADIRFENNQLMLSVPKSAIENETGLTFKWADNYTENDVYSFYTKGDCAPYGRLCYRY